MKSRVSISQKKVFKTLVSIRHIFQTKV